MFYIYNDLFADDKSKNKINEICEAVKNKKFVFECYCIILSTNSNNLFDIINVNELRFNYYHSMDIYVVGVSKGKKGAVDLLIDIIQKIAAKDHLHNIRDYFNNGCFVEM